MKQDQTKNLEILVIQTAFLGDLILSIPLLRNIKKTFPGSSIHLVCRSGLGEFMSKLDVVDYFYEIKKGSRQSYNDLATKISGIEFDYLFSPHSSIRTSLFVKKIKSKTKISFSSFWNNLFFDRRIKRDHKLPDPLRQLSLLSLVDNHLSSLLVEYSNENSISDIGPIPDWASLNLKPITIEKIKLSLDSKIKNEILNFIDPKFNTGVIFPGSTWNTKRWTIDGFREVVHILNKNKVRVILLGSKDEQSICQEIAKDQNLILDLSGQTSLTDSLNVLSLSQFCITNDNGGQHLASLLAKPTISIFGPTILEFGFRPWNKNIEIVEDRSVRCRPCGLHGHKHCPLKTHECMKNISARQVILSLKKLIPDLSTL